MNTSAVKYAVGRVIHAPSPRTKRVHYASNKAVRKAHKRAIEKFASMFRKLAE
jgi:hypothetical protein